MNERATRPDVTFHPRARPTACGNGHPPTRDNVLAELLLTIRFLDYSPHPLFVP